jgi:serine/threonine-protein kinase
MEYVEGSTLRQILRQRGRLPVGEAFDVAIEVAEGLQAVHDAGIIHRDLKATNVMLDRAGTIRLMDFGIAKQLQQEDTKGITATAQMVGTPEYMSPEQVRSERLDGRADVYSLGVLIFELFTGELPFHGDTPMSVILAHLETPPPLDGARATWLPRSVVPVLRKALAKDRNERYRSPREVAEALRAARAALAGPTLVQARPVVLGATAAQPLPVSPPEALTIPAPTPVGTPTPVVAATTPMPRPGRAPREEAPAAPRPPVAHREGLDARPRRRISVAHYLLGGGAVVAVLGLLALSRVAFRSGDDSAAGRVPASPPAAAPPTAPAVVPSVAPTTATPAPTAPPPTRAPALVRPPEPRPRRPESAAAPVATPVRPRPTPTPAAVRPAEPPVAAAPPSSPAVEPEGGTLRLHVVPWAEVTLDGRPVGTTPLKPLSLAPGVHTVRLQHPDYRPLQKKVNVRAGEVFVLEVDLAEEAFPLPAKER